MNEFRMSGSVDRDPRMTVKHKLTVFYLKTLRPSKSHRKIMIVKMVAFGKMACKCYDLIHAGMRIQVFGQLVTSTYADKRYMKYGLTKEQAERWVLQCVVRDFTFSSSQYDSDRLQIAMDIASSEDWVSFEKEKNDNPTGTVGEIGV